MKVMNNDDGMLSQEEIEALLNIDSNPDIDKSDDMKEAHFEKEEKLSSIEIDTIGEIGNISFGSSATTLSTLLNNKVEITTPEVSIIEKEDLNEVLKFQPVSIEVNYIDGFVGKSVFVIKAPDAAIIADIMLGGDGINPDSDLNEIHLSAVQEAMNQMMGAAATSMSTVFNKKVDISPPSVIDEDKYNGEIFEEDAYVKVSFRFIIGNLIDSNMMQLMPISFAKQLVDQLLNPSVEDQQVGVSGSQNDREKSYRSYDNEKNTLTEAENHSIKSTTQKKPEIEQQPKVMGNQLNQTNQEVEVQDATFSNLEKVELNSKEQRNLDMLLDIPLNITVELGRTKRPIKEILEFSAGSIIELDKLAGEPVDILVNNKLIAEGEVVVIDENFGVRVTDIVSKSDRLMNLK